MSDGAEFTVGAIADVQYADIPDGTNWDKTVTRYYRGALDKLKSAVQWWKDEGVDFTLNLADAIDGRNRAEGASEAALHRVMAEFASVGRPTYSAIGNHEMANFTTEQLQRLPYYTQGLRYSFTPRPGWRFIVVNTYERHVILADNPSYSAPLPTEEWYTECLQLLLANNPNLRGGESTWHSGIAWGAGLEESNARFLPYNGMVGTKQLEWLAEELAAAGAAGEKVIVCTHSPFLAAAATACDLSLDCEKVLELLAKHSASVKLVLAGHSHNGGMATDSTGITHVTLPSPLETAPEVQDCSAVLRFYADRIELEGRGRVSSCTIRF